jgi:hypothetical protein
MKQLAAGRHDIRVNHVDPNVVVADQNLAWLNRWQFHTAQAERAGITMSIKHNGVHGRAGSCASTARGSCVPASEHRSDR